MKKTFKVIHFCKIAQTLEYKKARHLQNRQRALDKFIGKKNYC